MNNAPLVYIPTQPESDGLTMPTLLSLLAHGIVLGLLIYTYQQPSLETTSAIETMMVSPEQLAEMQGQILANREAAAEAASSFDNTPSTESFDSSTGNTSPDSAQPSSQSVPVFMRSDEVADDYDATMQAFNRKMEQEAADRIQAPREEREQLFLDEQEELTVLKEVEKNPPPKTPNNKPPMVKKGNNGDISIANGAAGNKESMSLENDGEPKSFGSANNTNGSSSARSTGEFKNAILAEIKNKLNTPVETQGLTTSLSLKLDAQGNVRSAKARGSNPIVHSAVEKAAYAASPLSIDLANPTSYANLTINITID